MQWGRQQKGEENNQFRFSLFSIAFPNQVDPGDLAMSLC